MMDIEDHNEPGESDTVFKIPTSEFYEKEKLGKDHTRFP